MSEIETNQSAAAARFSPFERAVSLLELLAGIAIVVAHNVFKAVPNEVPILAALALLSFWLRDRGFRAIGWTRPKSWPLTLLWAIAAAAVVILLGELVTDPLTTAMWGKPPDTSSFSALTGNWRDAGMMLLLVWSFAAVGEEFGYRGYLLTRAADLGGRSTAAYVASLVLVSIVFGIGHYYQGPSGILSTACDGFVMGAAYLLSGRNFWVPILTHGLVDTFGIVVLFFGLAS